MPPALRDEIVIANAAGAGTENRISPRAAVALINALAARARPPRPRPHRRAAGLGHRPRHAPRVACSPPRPVAASSSARPAPTAREGASALAGALRTTRFGIVTFAVLNHGVPVPEARRRQDAFVTKLAAATGAEPWRYPDAAVPAFNEAEVHSFGRIRPRALGASRQCSDGPRYAIAFFSRSCASSAAEKPQSASASSVC